MGVITPFASRTKKNEKYEFCAHQGKKIMQHFFVIHIFLRVCEYVSTRSCEWHMPLLRYAHVFFYFSKRKTNQY